MALNFYNATVYGGQKGYVPYYQDPPNDIKPKTLDNGAAILIYNAKDMTPVELKDQRHDGYGKIYDPKTQAYLGYMEMSHISIGSPIEPTPPPSGGKTYVISGEITIREKP